LASHIGHGKNQSSYQNHQGTEELTMVLPKRYAKKQAKAKERQRQNTKARHQRQQQDAQHDINALHPALMELGLPDPLVLEIEGRLKAQKKLLGKMFGLMFPTLFGATSTYELTRVRGWDKNMPHVCSKPCPSAPGSSVCASSAKTSSCLFGVTSSR
jgi:hypothetical protein